MTRDRFDAGTAVKKPFQFLSPYLFLGCRAVEFHKLLSEIPPEDSFQRSSGILIEMKMQTNGSHGGIIPKRRRETSIFV